jgi:hypothetical protein
MSSLPLFTPKNSIGFTVSRLMIVSVNSIQFRWLASFKGGSLTMFTKPAKGSTGLICVFCPFTEALPFFLKYNLTTLLHPKVTY